MKILLYLNRPTERREENYFKKNNEKAKTLIAGAVANPMTWHPQGSHIIITSLTDQPLNIAYPRLAHHHLETRHFW